MTELERLLRRELYRKSLYDFVKEFWECADPAPFIDGKLIQAYCEIFQYKCRAWCGYEEIKITVPKMTDDIDVIDVRDGRRNTNINVPPRHTKSKIFNVFGPTWLWLSCPSKAASLSHTRDLAGKMNAARHSIINSDKFHYYFPEIKLATNTAFQLVDKRGGELYSQSRDAMTGYGADIIICDDLTNAEAARKDKAEMDNARSFFRNTLPSRINDPNTGVIFNIQQRIAPNDITGYILSDPKLSSQYSFVTLQAIFEKETYLVCPISGDVLHWKKGEPLWKERFGDYESVKLQVGDAVFETQYQQHPVASDKAIIKPDMIYESDEIDTPGIDRADIVYASHDFPVKDKETSDFLGSVLGYRVGAKLYIMDCLEKKMAFVKSVEYTKAIDSLYPGIIQVIEDKANGSPILQQLQDELAGLQAYQPGTASKTQRLESASIYMHSGNVVFVRSVWNGERYILSESLQNLKNRLLNFPFVSHDDIIDAFDMLVLFVFMDKKYSVYGLSFNEQNVVSMADKHEDYTTVFFNREGDIWKMAEVGVIYGETTKLIVKKELRFKGTVDEGLKALQKFAPTKRVFIDCSASDALNGMIAQGVTVERYSVDDFDQSVAQLNLAFSKNLVMLDKGCVLIKSDIESFKYAKSKDETVKYITEKDGFVACLRIALKYFGGIA